MKAPLVNIARDDWWDDAVGVFVVKDERCLALFPGSVGHLHWRKLKPSDVVLFVSPGDADELMDIAPPFCLKIQHIECGRRDDPENWEQRLVFDHAWIEETDIPSLAQSVRPLGQQREISFVLVEVHGWLTHETRPNEDV
jgi:hypothetical protein